MSRFTAFLEHLRIPAVVLAVAVALIPPVIETFRVMDAEDSLDPIGTPSVTFNTLMNDLARVHQELTAKPGATPESYYYRIVDARDVEYIYRKFMRENPYVERDDLLRHGRPVIDNYQFWISDLQVKYWNKFSIERMMQVRQRTDISALTANYVAARRPDVPNHILRNALAGYLFSILFAALYFTAAIKREQMVIWVEFFGRLPVAAIAWPFHLKYYPREIDIRLQLYNLRRRLAYLFAMFLSAAPVGAFAKAMNGNDMTGGSVDTTHTLVVDDIRVPAIDLSLGIMSEKISPNGVTLHPGPVWTSSGWIHLSDDWSIGYAGTRALSGSNGSDENDWGARWNHVFKKSKTTVTITGMYLDIRPLASTKRGDFFMPNVEVDQVFGPITLFAYGELDWFWGHSANSAYTLQTGVKKSFELPFGFSTTGSASMIHGSGPFEHEEGNLARFDVSLAHPITPELSINLWAKELVPFSRFGDRRSSDAVGLGLTFKTE